jgi:hypothetical protein
MALKELYNKAAAVEAGTSVSLPSIQGNPTGLFQVKNAGTATVVLQGRLVDDDALADWVDIHTFTDESGAQQVALFPFMRVNITAQTSTPTVSAYVHA